VTFGRTDAEFWEMTVGQISALMDIHKEYHGTGDGTTHPSNERRLSIDDPAAADVLASFASGRMT
jgi:hypothetical protein